MPHLLPRTGTSKPPRAAAALTAAAAAFAASALNPGAAWAAQVGAGRSLHWRDGYPMSGYSWVLVSASQSSQATGKALVSLLGCLTGPGQSYAAALGYVPLPHAVQQLAAATLAQVTGPGSQPLTG